MTLRPLIRDLVRGPLRSPLDRRGGWTPAILFSAGEQGGWYDFSDLTTLYQDSAGTTPVTAAGQPVGKVLDKSGRGNHLIQATAASRPVLQQDATGFYLLPDGVDDWLGNAAFPAIAQPFAVSMALTNYTGGSVDANLYRFNAATGPVGFRAGGAATWSIFAGVTFSNATPFTTNPVVRTDTYSGASSSMRADGVAFTGDAGTGAITLGAMGLFASSAPANFAAARCYGVVILGRQPTASEYQALERYLARKQGRAL